jgi:phenylalanyl-tRNA synthetase beta chain
MNVSLRWLEAFLRRPLDADDVVRRLAMLGAPVDAVEPLHAGLGDIVVALVEEVRPHPNADRLCVCLVNDGSPVPRNVVCGAPNVRAGRKYPFAPVGATVPHGKGGAPMTMARAKLRGEVSEGMLCSARDLALGQEHDGLLELDTDAAPGTRLLDAVPLGDHRLVIDVTPNRPDLLGHKGVARELAAAYGVPFRLPAIPSERTVDVLPSRRVTVAGEVGGVEVQIEDTEGCGRFHAAVVRGVRVGPSPVWLRERLEAVGERSINNVVDATNYVMLELNQPMHAYDLRRLRGARLVVRRAAPGERLATLDGADRALDGDTIAIADGEGAIGIAGIMGGASSEIGPETEDVFLEAAYWDPGRIRRARRALGLSTGASYRFERGVDRWAGADAMRRCIEVIVATAGGELAEAPLDLWPQPTNPVRIFLRPARVAQVLGVELAVPLLERYLIAIGATVLSKPDDARIAVDVPGWRPDLLREIDLVEEIARLHGYDNFPADLRRFRLGTLADAPVEEVAAAVRRGLVAEGLFEVSSLPLGPGGDNGGVRLLNPLSATDSYLRGRLLPGLVRLVEGNWANHVADVRLFEIGTVFEAAGAGERPREERRVAGVLTGRRAPAHWSDARPEPFDLWDVKGCFEAAVALANPHAQIQVQGSAWIARDPEGKVVGEAAMLAADAPPWAAPLYGFEVALDPSPRGAPRFVGVPSTPSSERVLALVMPVGVAVAEVEALLRRVGGSILEQVGIESDYRGPGVPDGSRSVAFRLAFRAPDRTLRDADVDAIEARMLAALADDLGIGRRDATGGVRG